VKVVVRVERPHRGDLPIPAWKLGDAQASPETCAPDEEAPCGSCASHDRGRLVDNLCRVTHT